MEAPGFGRVTDVSSVEQQGQGFGFVDPAKAVIQLHSWSYAGITRSSEVLKAISRKPQI